MTSAPHTVVVTGAAGDLGAAISTAFGSTGWNVALIDLDEQRVEETARSAGGHPFVADVRDADALTRTLGEVHAALGDIDCLVNAAGLTRPSPSAELRDEDWRLVVDVNLNGTFFACRAAFPFLKRGQASIVNISSVSATRVMPGRSAYSASKAAVNGLTASLAVEWAPHGVRVNAVAPAWIDSTFLRALAAQGVLDPQDLVAKIPLGRLCTNDDVVAAVRFLADPASSGFITGQTLHVDGGYLPAG